MKDLTRLSDVQVPHRHQEHLSQDPEHLMNKVRRVELLVGRLRARKQQRQQRYASYPSGSASNIDPSLSLVDKARMLKYRAIKLNRRVQSDKSDETTYTTVTRSTARSSAGGMFWDDASVTWYQDTLAYDDYDLVEI